MNNVPDDWPRCPVCGEPAFEGHVSCCRRSCHELAATYFGKVLELRRRFDALRRYSEALERQIDLSVIEEIKTELEAQDAKAK